MIPAHRLRTLLLLAVLTPLASCRGTSDTVAERADEDGGAPVRLRALRLASDVWPPFTDVEEQPRVALDLVHTALDRAAIAATTTIRPDFGELLDDIRRGELDGSAALWRTPEREEFLLYSRPYLENRLVLVGRKGSDLTATSLEELAGRSVAVVASYGYGEALRGAPGPRLVEGPSDQDNLRSLLRGEVDFVLADELLVHTLFERYPQKARALLEAGTRSLLKRPLHLAVRRDLPDAEEIIARFDAAIGELMADGSYNRLLLVDWLNVDVDGDGVSELVLGGQRAGVAPPGRGYDVFEPEARTETPNRYIIEGRSYESWDRVPPRYKVPAERSKDPLERTTDEPREWGVVLFEF